MLNIKEFCKEVDGKTVVDTEAYNKAYTAEVDRERTVASTSARENAKKEMRDALKEEVRKEIEEETKLTIEEKNKKEREKIEAERLELNKEKVRNVFEKTGLYDDAEISELMTIVTLDGKVSLEKANKLAELRKTKMSEYEKTLTEKIQSGLQQPNGQNTNKNDNSEISKLINKKQLPEIKFD
jgi:hypothetical protein